LTTTNDISIRTKSHHAFWLESIPFERDIGDGLPFRRLSRYLAFDIGEVSSFQPTLPRFWNRAMISSPSLSAWGSGSGEGANETPGW
jgi:hypothetical protein